MLWCHGARSMSKNSNRSTDCTAEWEGGKRTEALKTCTGCSLLLLPHQFGRSQSPGLLHDPAHPRQGRQAEPPFPKLIHCCLARRAVPLNLRVNWTQKPSIKIDNSASGPSGDRMPLRARNAGRRRLIAAEGSGGKRHRFLGLDDTMMKTAFRFIYFYFS